MKKSLKFILTAMLIIILGMSSFSMAASGNSSGKVELKPSKSSVKSGESFTVEVAQECSDGIIGFEANLNYDANVFEFKGADMDSNWTNLGEGTKLEAMANNDQKSGNVFVLKFDVNKNVSETTSEITVTGVKLYKTAEETISVEDAKTSIKVNEVVNNDGDQGQNPDQTPEEQPTPVTLSSISVTKVPAKTEYKSGEKFDVSGMEITAKYSDGTSKKVTDFTYSPNGKLKTSDKKVTISYKDGDVTKTVDQTITVKAVAEEKPSNNTVENTTKNTVNNTAKNTVSNNTVKNTTNNTVKNNTVNNTAKNTTKVTSATNNTANVAGLPKTGSAATTISLAVFVLIGIAAISYVGYQKYKGI